MSQNVKRTGLLATGLLLVGAVAAVAAGDAHHVDSGALLKDFIYRAIDFSLVAGIIVYFTRKPIREGLAGRSRNIAQALTEAQTMRDQAEAKFAEYDRKLARANEEIAELSAAIKAEALEEHDRILEEAHRLSTRLREEAARTADQEIARAKAELQRETAAAAVMLAEEILAKSVSKEDQARLVDEYLQKLGELH